MLYSTHKKWITLGMVDPIALTSDDLASSMLIEFQKNPAYHV